VSVKYLSGIQSIPIEITMAFRNAEEPKNSQETLWREVAARATLDALGYTGRTAEPDQHDAIIKEARLWFKGIPIPESPHIVFDNASLLPYFPKVKEAVLNYPVTYMTDIEDDYDDEFEEYLDVDSQRTIEELDPDFIG
jgi:hypothetical protein